MGKKPFVSVTYENERISIKDCIPYLKGETSSCFVLKSFHFRRFRFFYFQLGPPVLVACVAGPSTETLGSDRTGLRIGSDRTGIFAFSAEESF